MGYGYMSGKLASPYCCYYTARSQLNQALLFIQWGPFFTFFTQWDCHISFILWPQKKVCIAINKNFHAFYACWEHFIFYCWYFILFKPISISKWIWILKFMRFSFVPLNHEHQDSTKYSMINIFQNLQHQWFAWKTQHTKCVAFYQ